MLEEGKPDKEQGMRIGADYQAVVPEDYEPPGEAAKLADKRPEPLQVWAPCHNIPDEELDVYLKTAKERHGYNMEQALGMLYWHGYHIERALEDLKHFTPLPDEWSLEDKVIFDQSFSSYGKHFSRIRQQLPDKSIGSLVRYYYLWKKNRNKTSLMDKEAKRINLKNMGGINALFTDDDDGNDSEESDFEHDGKPPSDIKPSPMLSTNCVNCAGVTAQMHPTPRGKMCTPCFEYWKRTGILRPKDSSSEGSSLTALYRGPQHKLKKKPPKGMQITEDALLEVAQSQGDDHVRRFDVELINHKRQIMTVKDVLGKQKTMISSRIDQFRPPELVQKGNPRWTNEELLVAVQCVRKYGKDFQAMAEVLGNKNINQCHNFFVNYRRRFNLIDVLYEYEKENNIPRSDPMSTPMELWDENMTQSPTSATSSKEEPKDNSTNNNIPRTSSSLPPPLYRESDPPRPTHTDAVKNPPTPTASSVGPPPLVNNSAKFSISSLAGK